MAMKHWLVGCGLGCGAVLLIVVALGFTGAFFVRNTMRGFETAIQDRQALEERFGKPEDYVPPADGVVPPERMEVFLAVRESLQPQRETLVRVFSGFPMTKEEGRELDSKPALEKLRAVTKIAGSAIGLGKDLGAFFEARNRALLEQGIGMGEYTYDYVVAYYSWLGHDPEDGPEDVEVDARGPGIVTQRGHDSRWGDSGRRIREEVVSMLRNQLAALPDDADESWRSRLAAEVEALESDPDRVPWAGGLPDGIVRSLEPFRDRLEALYNPASNPFELVRNQKQGTIGVRVD